MKKRGRKIAKRIGIGLLLVALLGTILGFIYYDDAKDYLMAEIVDYINETQNGHLEIDEMELAIFHQLPDISVKLSQVKFYEQKDSLRPLDQPPIIEASRAYLALEPWELISHKKLVVTALSMEEVTLDIVAYEDNKTNLERALSKPTQTGKDKISGTVASERPRKKQPAGDTAPNPPPEKKVSKPVKTDYSKGAEAQNLEIALQNIHLKNVHLKYNNPHEAYSSEIALNSLDGALALTKEGITADMSIGFEITRSNQYPLVADLGPADLLLDLEYNAAAKSITIRKGALNYDDLRVALEGRYDHLNGNYIDMDFDASSNNVALFSKLIQEEVLEKNTASIKRAGVELKGSIKGRMEDQVPNINIIFGIDDLNFTDVSGKLKFSNFGFRGNFKSGEADDFSQAELEIQNLHGQTPGGAVSGDFSVRNFQRPQLKSTLAAKLNLEGYETIFHLPGIDSLSGKVSLHTDFDGVLNFEKQHEMDDIGSWSLDMTDISFFLIPSGRKVRQLSGTIREANNEVVVDSLSLFYGRSDIAFQGQLKNLYHFIFNKEQGIAADIEISSSEFFTSHLIVKPNASPTIDDRITDLVIKAKFSGMDNEDYASYFPSFTAELEQLSFELDSLPGIENLKANIGFNETEAGYNFRITDAEVQLPLGKIDFAGDVLLPRDFRRLETDAQLGIADVPIEYIVDLVNDLKGSPLVGSKNLSEADMKVVNGELNVSGVMELLPFAVSGGDITALEIAVKMPDTSLYSVQNLSLRMDSLYFRHNENNRGVEGIEVSKGELHLDAINGPAFSNIPLDFTFSAINDQLNVGFSTLRDSVMLDVGSLSMGINGSPYDLEASYRLESIDLASLIRDYSSQKLIDGSIDAFIELKGTGANLEDLTSSLKGNISIQGDSLNLYGIDLDDLLRKYKRSQTFNLADISAFVLAGPMGAAVTKGADFTRLLNIELKPDQHTFVSQAVVDWSIDQGMVSTQDVAFSTRANRLSFLGSLDFVRDTIPGFTVYVLDKKGCSLMEQRLYGKFGAIEMGKLKIAETLLGSVINLVESLVGKKCEVVYSGQVAHPNAKS
ncbi:AsmA-like C-terminal region-containing protein [Robiginitalea aurantiaca]|uniref:AsmA-like C-terminal region-containing protein n=1 Tax=Robiginitalea aurantiaca TaxID=3056915 RepID=A0ABT7WIG2_9FLAO|nr:AsmA-like C-terminal region-containing protein [Robiginitalea aurantiaca]MDM9632716.1 AsmA-like C-terminal region-containing protein [Robiginitalea aurantiaca]